MPPSFVKRYTLTAGENTFSSPASINEADARKLQSLIPSLSGALEREHPSILFATNGLPTRVGFFHQFGRNVGAVTNFFWFCATATTLYQLNNPGPTATWVPVTAIGTLAGFPAAVTIDNVMQLDDGVKSWIFDGTNWIRTGLAIPLHPPTITPFTPPAAVTITSITRGNNVVTATVTGATTSYATGMAVTVAGVGDASFNSTVTLIGVAGPILQWNQFGQPDASSTAGTVTPPSITILANRYYWTTWVDQTTGRRQHESSSSPISVGTGPQTGKLFLVNQRFGLVSCADGVNVIGTGTDFAQNDVGMVLYSGAPGLVGVVKTVTDATHIVLDPLATPYTSNVVTPPAPYVIAPSRATHWNVYASASETDKLGNLLGTVAIAQTNFVDSSPMIGTPGSVFSSVQRPLLNDPPPPSTMLKVHKNRIYRRVESNPNFFSRTGFEEIQAEQAGSPYECVPGADPNTVSPATINEESFPDQSVRVRGFESHGDALYIGTERDILPWYGDNNSNFSFSSAYAFKVGLAGQRAWCSTPFGLAFVSYDFKVYLYPSQYSFGVDSTTALVELGRPKRPEFELMSGTDLSNVHLIFYNWGRRNWLVMTYQRRDGTFGAWGFDFEVKGWFQFQRGYTAVTVFELTPGLKVLVGAGTDNKTYVIDDLTGTFPVSGNYPVGYFRALVDFGEPDTYFAIKEIGHERSTSAMEVDVTIWLDPVDPENPGVGIPLVQTETRIGANSYSSRPNSDTGGLCQRVLVEFAIAASPVNGRFHGFTIEAEKEMENPTL